MEEQRIISKCVADKIYELVSNPDDKVNPEFLEDEEIIARLQTIKLSLLNHNETVQQNRNLQGELNKANSKLEEIKKKPFFPYPLNSGNNADYGAFILISHAWFSFLNTAQQVGIVEVQYKNDGRRVMYVGITTPVATEEGFNNSVLEIAQFGQKIKDSSEG